MNTNRIEFESLPPVCSTCLSADRKLHSMEHFVKLLSSCNELSINPETDYLCWECKAMLLKFWNFKQNVAKAHQTLTTHIQNTTEKLPSLSNLTIADTTNKNIYDYQYRIKEEDSVSNQPEPEVKVELVNVYEEAVTADIKSEIANSAPSEDDDSTVSETESETEDVAIENDTDVVISANEEVKVEKDKANFILKILNEDEFVKFRETQQQQMWKSNNPNQCGKCIVAFRSESALKEHVESSHNKNNGEYKCKVCRCYFAKLSRLHTHFKRHYKVYECVRCNHKAKTRTLICNHFANKHNVYSKPYFCRICKKQFLKKWSMMYHKKTAHAEVICDICGKALKEKYSLKSHMLLHTGMPMFDCPVCKKSLRGKRGLYAHMRVHRPDTSEDAYCAECNMQFRSVYIYRQHLKEHSKHITQRLQCSECEKTFASKPNLKRHISLQHNLTSDHVCSICNKIYQLTCEVVENGTTCFKRHSAVSLHTRERTQRRPSVHRQLGPQKLINHIKHVHNKIPKPKIFECLLCNKKFSTKRILEAHMNIHTGDRPYKCKLCEASFAQSGALYKHKQLVHKMKKQSEQTLDQK